jgi:8-oxo-dGTP diphosphatase
MKGKIKVLVKTLIIHKGKILLIRRSNQNSLPGYWDFPGGHVEFLETRIKAAIREVKEETGLKAKNFKELNTMDIIPKKRNKHFILTFYKANSPTNKVKLSKEHDKYQWVSKFPSRKLHPLIKFCKIK